MLAMIKTKYPDWDSIGNICLDDLNQLRTDFIEQILETGEREVESLETDSLKAVAESELFTRNLNNEYEKSITIGEKAADRLAAFGGSWIFIGIFFLVLFVWVVINTTTLTIHPFDPYPFIFLNLILSCIAAIQAPVILMSQNRQDAKDRFRAEQDFRTNLKAELEIRSIHDKLDFLLVHQWQRLLEIQKIQVDIMGQIGKPKPESPKIGT
jgi:uncharacterized membrane protein